MSTEQEKTLARYSYLQGTAPLLLNDSRLDVHSESVSSIEFLGRAKNQINSGHADSCQGVLLEAGSVPR